MMQADTRQKNQNWVLGSKVTTWDQVQCALLMDIRDELQKLNALLHCPNFTRIPHALDCIERNTAAAKKRKRKKAK